MKILILLSIFFFLTALSVNGEEYSPEKYKTGNFTELTTGDVIWRAPKSTAAVIVPPNQNKVSIHYWGNKDQNLVLDFGKMKDCAQILLDVERWTSAPPFEMTVEIQTVSNGWKPVLTLGAQTPVGFGRIYPIKVTNKFNALRFKINTKKDLGILIHGITLVAPGPMKLENAKLLQKTAEVPLVIAANKSDKADRFVQVQAIEIQTDRLDHPLAIDQTTFRLTGTDMIANFEVCLNGKKLTASNKLVEGKNVMKFEKTPLAGGKNILSFRGKASDQARLKDRISISVESVTISGQTVSFDPQTLFYNFAVMVRDRGWDGVNCYRIPGLIRSNKGTLLAVYDIRHHNANDLPEDIDIGCSRSFDGGKTWQPMQVIMNQQGKDETKEGVGDPSILVDRNTGRIWVAALWAHNGYSTGQSLPGLKPETSGQMLLVFSDDDGMTWSKPINITPLAAKGKNWRLLFQGPGAGIMMRNGTLVFPAQYIDADRGWYSTIVWSQDHGKTWTVGTGARPATCEAQIVELNDGSLMINMRNFKEKSRSVAITSDLGKTWTEHSSSLRTLPDPICQASLLKLRSVKDGDSEDLWAFANPHSTKNRIDMTVQFSKDEGKTWTKKILLNSNYGYGYSCMDLIDRNNLGILYETPGGLLFQRINFQN